MKLVIDIGNTRTKMAIFRRDEIVELLTVQRQLTKAIDGLLLKYPNVSSGILSSVRDLDEKTINDINARVPVQHLTHRTPLPFINKYRTPETLGRDRIAAVAAGMHYFPKKNILVIDAGTCITYDILTAAGEYLGGAISPGLHMRFRAMHEMTGKLPLVKPVEGQTAGYLGGSTTESLLAGGQAALLAEMDGMIDRYRAEYEDLKVVLGGGDHIYFDKYLKNNIFAAPNLVVVGLKRILDFNEG